MKNKRKLTKKDTNIIFYSFRYALGRKTAVVSEVVDYILNHWDQIPAKDKYQMGEEIETVITEDRAGDDCDVEEWTKILNKI